MEPMRSHLVDAIKKEVFRMLISQKLRVNNCQAPFFPLSF